MKKEENVRKDIPDARKWDLSVIFESDQEWETEFKALEGIEKPLLMLKGRLAQSAKNLAKITCLEDELDRKISKIYVYAHLKSDEDTANTHYMGMQERIKVKASEIDSMLSWIEPEIMKIDEKKLLQLIKEPELAKYQREFELLLRDKPHTLSEKEEKLLSMVANPLGTASKTYGLLSNADMTFPEVADEKGEKKELTHGNYVHFLENSDRNVRKSAFEAMYDTYGKLKNTLASLIEGNVKNHVFSARVCNFDSALKASLHGDHVPQTVYDNLIKTIHEGFPAFYKYIDLRKKALSLKTLDMYDIYVPIVPDFKLEVPYDEAIEWVRESIKPLGKDYCTIAEKAFSERWIDVEETKGKRSGAYSSGCYDTYPYILLNYQENLDNVFTLAHELGHSMHSYFSHETQPHITSDYRIFVAEVASTTNEMLLHHYLFNKTDNKDMKMYLLNHLCDGFKGTMFRQTMFAEFEKLIHENVENSVPLTPDKLSGDYYALNSKYYGKDVVADKRIELEWARIPHFYYNFYVYKYATGFAAAQAFSDKILNGDKSDIEKYLNFLRAGDSKDPIDILKDAGVDLRTPQPVQNALKIFDASVAKLSKMLFND
ncbi:MAG: oligoendopeptidase F [Verrucomicrobiota bacterium]|nr:oligoendopeptidase F [Verrucomicrobiota bacterium]